jgi:hypothetical protein
LHSDTQTITARTWLMETVCATLFLLIVVVLVNMSIDIYGIFRSAKGRHLLVFGDERIAKYLLSEKYVPENFDTLLIGTSVSANWNTGGINALRVYNESLDGGNIVEEKAIADQALSNSHIRAAILILHPYLTSSHEFETVRLTPRENLAALGSQSLLDAYKSKVRVKLHLEKQEFDEFGTDDFGDIPQKMNPHLQKLMAPGTEFSIDGPAMASYRALVDELHASNIQIIYVIPPVLQSIYLPKAGAFANYSQAVLENKRAGDRIIDFTSNEFVDFRSNPGNFKDGVHLTNQSAQEVVTIINARVTQWIQNGQLPSKPTRPLAPLPPTGVGPRFP